MTTNITSYTGLGAAISAWMARDGDTDIAARFDDILTLCEQRIYYGKTAMPSLMLPAHEAIRIPEMETASTSFALSATVAQPTGFLELISANLNSPNAPLDIVDQSVIDAYKNQSFPNPIVMALSGSNFRIFPDPGSSYTATLRYYAKLTSPSATNATNWILTYAPGVYLNGCLLEAAIFTQALEEAKVYAALYAADAAGLNERRNRQFWSARNLKVRLRGSTP